MVGVCVQQATCPPGGGAGTNANSTLCPFHFRKSHSIAPAEAAGPWHPSPDSLTHRGCHPPLHQGLSLIAYLLQGSIPDRFYEDALEALIGALYLDRGVGECRRFILDLIDKARATGLLGGAVVALASSRGPTANHWRGGPTHVYVSILSSAGGQGYLAGGWMEIHCLGWLGGKRAVSGI